METLYHKTIRKSHTRNTNHYQIWPIWTQPNLIKALSLKHLLVSLEAWFRSLKPHQYPSSINSIIPTSYAKVIALAIAMASTMTSENGNKACFVSEAMALPWQSWTTTPRPALPNFGKTTLLSSVRDSSLEEDATGHGAEVAWLLCDWWGRVGFVGK